jgi:hypothetical protein
MRDLTLPIAVASVTLKEFSLIAISPIIVGASHSKICNPFYEISTEPYNKNTIKSALSPVFHRYSPL